MDGIESIGMPVSLPLTETPNLTPYSVALRSQQGAQAGHRVQGHNSSMSAAQLDEQKKQVGKDFESVLLGKLFEQVQASIEDSGFDEEDTGAPQVRSMFWLYLARDVADKGGLGLWKDIYQQIKEWDGTGDLPAGINEEL